nr:unnamed protein product [Digitaria exilis]
MGVPGGTPRASAQAMTALSRSSDPEKSRGAWQITWAISRTARPHLRSIALFGSTTVSRFRWRRWTLSKEPKKDMKNAIRETYAGLTNA